jgi:hypothetical protein
MNEIYAFVMIVSSFGLVGSLLLAVACKEPGHLFYTTLFALLFVGSLTRHSWKEPKEDFEIIPFNSTVLIKSGFYKGHYGKVKRLTEFGEPSYVVDMIGTFKISNQIGPKANHSSICMGGVQMVFVGTKEDEAAAIKESSTLVLNLYKDYRGIESVDAKDCEKMSFDCEKL